MTSFNKSDHVFFQGVLTTGEHAGEQAMFVVDNDTPGIRVVRTPAYTHTFAHHHPIVAFEDVRVPASQLIGSEAAGMSFVYEWFRYERLMIGARCLGRGRAAGRRDAGVRRRSAASATSTSPTSSWCRACSPTA